MIQDFLEWIYKAVNISSSQIPNLNSCLQCSDHTKQTKYFQIKKIEGNPPSPTFKDKASSTIKKK